MYTHRELGTMAYIYNPSALGKLRQVAHHECEASVDYRLRPKASPLLKSHWEVSHSRQVQWHTESHNRIQVLDTLRFHSRKR